MNYRLISLCDNRMSDWRSCSMHGIMKNHTILWLETMKRSDYLEDLGVDGKMILERILRK